MTSPDAIRARFCGYNVTDFDLAIADHQMRELEAKVGERGPERIGAGVFVCGDRGIAGRTGGKGEHRVTGGCVAVHRDAGEAGLVRGGVVRSAPPG